MELGFCLASVHLHVQNLVELVASRHLLYFAFGDLLEHLEFAEFAVDLVDQVLVLAQLLHHRLAQSGQRLVHLLPGDEVVLTLEQTQRGHDAFLEGDQFEFEFVFQTLHLELVGAVAVTQSAEFSVHVTEFMWVDAVAVSSSHRRQHVVQGVDLVVDFAELGADAVNLFLLLGQGLDQPEFQFLRVLPLLESVDLDEQFLDPDVVIPLIMLDLLPGLKLLGLLGEFLDEQFVLPLVVLDVAAQHLEFALEGVVAELQFVELLAAVVRDVVQYFAFELLQGLLDVLWGYLLEEGGLALVYFPQGFLLDFLCRVLELADLLVGLHLELLQAGQYLLTFVFREFFGSDPCLPEPLLHVLLVLKSVQKTREVLYFLVHLFGGLEEMLQCFVVWEVPAEWVVRLTQTSVALSSKELILGRDSRWSSLATVGLTLAAVAKSECALRASSLDNLSI